MKIADAPYPSGNSTDSGYYMARRIYPWGNELELTGSVDFLGAKPDIYAIDVTLCTTRLRPSEEFNIL